MQYAAQFDEFHDLFAKKDDPNSQSQAKCIERYVKKGERPTFELLSIFIRLLNEKHDGPKPPLISRLEVGFGKYKGKTWGEVPTDYLLWLQKSIDEKPCLSVKDVDLQALLKEELEWRERTGS